MLIQQNKATFIHQKGFRLRDYLFNQSHLTKKKTKKRQTSKNCNYRAHCLSLAPVNILLIFNIII